MLPCVHSFRGRTLPLCLAVISVLIATFQQFVQFPQSPTFIQKYLNKFLCSYYYYNNNYNYYYYYYYYYYYHHCNCL